MAEDELLADKKLAQAKFSEPTEQSIVVGSDASSIGAQELASDLAASLNGSKEANFGLVGRTLGQYQILALIGEGGMGTVYKAKQVATGKIVALKVVHRQLCSKNSTVMRFQQEARAAASLNHPNTTSVHHFDTTDDGVPYFCMDYVDGKSLSALIESEGALPLERAKDLFLQICAGLQHAHAKGVVHRDIKPSNVLVARDDDGRDLVKIVDFGIAKILDAEGAGFKTITETGSVMGSPAYMSPEQCRGARVDTRSDIYSLGCVMYETLTGVPPHVGANPLDTIYRHLNDEPRSMSEIASHAPVPAGLEAIVRNAMAKDPDQRYQNVGELVRDLQAGASAKLRIEGRSAGWKRRAATWFAFAAIVAIAVTIARDACDPYRNIDTQRQVAWSETLPREEMGAGKMEPEFTRLTSKGEQSLRERDVEAARSILPRLVTVSEGLLESGFIQAAARGFKLGIDLQSLVEPNNLAAPLLCELCAGDAVATHVAAMHMGTASHMIAEEQLRQALPVLETGRAAMNERTQKLFFRAQVAYAELLWAAGKWSAGAEAYRHLFQDLRIPDTILSWANTPANQAKYADCLRLSARNADEPQFGIAYGIYDRLKDTFANPVDKALCYYHLATMKLHFAKPALNKADADFKTALRLLESGPSDHWSQQYKGYIEAQYADFLWRHARPLEAMQMRWSAHQLLDRDLRYTNFPLAKRSQ